VRVGLQGTIVTNCDKLGRAGEGAVHSIVDDDDGETQLDFGIK
jgi:hypothetical protein